MNIEVIEESDKHLRFIVREVSVAFINTLRRVIKSEVPTMAIDIVNYVENSSALYDEMLALRLGLVPLKTDLETYVTQDKCSCKGEGCGNCTCSFVLNVRGTPEGYVVNSSELQSKDPSIVPCYDKIPLVYLLSHQRVELEAIARLGRGKEHVKWQPGIVGYKHIAILNVDEDKCTSCKKCVEICPRGVLTVKKRIPVLKNEYDCSLCRDCEKICEAGAIKIDKDVSSFVMTVESFGQLTPRTMIEKAVEIIEEKIKGFQKSVKDI